MKTATLRIPGHCPSKKNHYRVVPCRKFPVTGAYRLAKDDAVTTYEKKAILLLRSQWSGPPLAELTDIGIAVDFYRNEPDDVGVAETIYDALQAAGVVANDRLLRLCGNPAIRRHKVPRRADEGVAIALRWGYTQEAPVLAAP